MQTYLCRQVPTAEGIGLTTDVYTPSGGGSFPVVLVRTPYHRTGLQSLAPRFVERGYALVVQDCRGKFDSQGIFEPLVYEAVDGQITLDWIANHKWCNGKIGLWGRSYLGIFQVPAASGAHEALRCIAPSVAPGSFFRDWIRYDGCFALGNAVRWSLIHASCPTQPPLDHFDCDELYQLENTDAIAARVGFATPILKTWAARDAYDEYWEAIDQNRMHEHIAVPGLHVGGWFDHLTRGQYESYKNIRDHGATPAARRGQRLLIGPWGHKNTGTTGTGHRSYGDWDFGPEADYPVLAHELQFLDFHLRDEDNGLASQQAVKVFLMGANRWLELADWPAPEIQLQNWYLDSDGSANMRTGNGKLSPTPPVSDASDTYIYNPAAPVPTRGGAIYWGLEARGPVDLRTLLERPDILYYRSEPLAEQLTVVGDIELELQVQSSAEDTDFIARLCVEEPTGSIICLTLGSQRCRYRCSWSDPEPLAKDQKTRILVQLGQLAYVFQRGSRIALVLTSSDFPRILPHPNTMAGPWQEGALVVARNSILHGPAIRSRLQLPVIEL